MFASIVVLSSPPCIHLLKCIFKNIYIFVLKEQKFPAFNLTKFLNYCIVIQPRCHI